MLVALAATAAILSSSQSAYRNSFPLPGPVVSEGWGVNIHMTHPAQGEVRQIAEGGFRWVRMDLFWHQIEKAKGQYDFSAYDHLVAQLEKERVRPLFILCYGNDLYEPGAPKLAESQEAFARFAAAAVKRFKGKGAIWEMWNEPNIHFWVPRPNVKEYIALAQRVGRAIRQVAPEEWHVGPAMAGFDWTFLEECFRSGLLQNWDAVTIHPYRTAEPESVVGDWARLRRLIDRYAPKGRDIPMLSGEWGYSEKYAGLDRDRQALYITRQMLTNLACGVNLSIWYDWKNDGEDPKEPEHWFGAVDHERRPKPAYVAAQSLSKALSGYRFHMRLAQKDPSQWLLLFERGGRLKAVRWTARRGGAEAPSVNDVPGQVAGVLLRWPALPPTVHARDFAREIERQRKAVGALGGQATVELDGVRQPIEGKFRTAPGASSGPSRLSVALKVRGMSFLQETLMLPERVLALDLGMDLLGRPVATVRNVEAVRFKGTLRHRQPDGKHRDRALMLAPSEDAWSAVLEGSTSPSRVQLLDEKGRVALERRIGSLVALRLAPDAFEAGVEGDEKVEGSAKASLEGDAIRFDYHFRPGWKYAPLYARAEWAKPLAGKPSSLGVWVEGDGSGHLLRLRYTDSKGQTFQPDGGAVTWKGWRLVTFTLEDPNVGHWGGPADGIIRYPIRLESPILLDSAGGRGGQGTLRFKGFHLVSQN